MTKRSLSALGFVLCTTAVLAQTPKPEIITHLNGLDVEISAMGVPTANTAAGGELVGIRAVKVMNNTEDTVTCQFHVPHEARADASAPPVFTVSPRTQRVERVPGEYSPDRPFAEVTCRGSRESIGTPTLPPATEPSSAPADAAAGAPANDAAPGQGARTDTAPAEPVDRTRSRETSNRNR